MRCLIIYGHCLPAVHAVHFAGHVSALLIAGVEDRHAGLHLVEQCGLHRRPDLCCPGAHELPGRASGQLQLQWIQWIPLSIQSILEVERTLSTADSEGF